MSGPRSAGEPGEPLVLFEILQTGRLAERAFTTAFASVGLPPGQFGILAALSDEPGLTQADVARRLLVRPQSITRQVRLLLDAGLVRADRSLRRGAATGLRVTPAGARLLDAAWVPAQATSTPAVLGLTPAEAAELALLLGRVREHLGDHDDRPKA